MKKIFIIKMSIVLFSLMLFSLSLLTFSQTTTIPFSETIVYTTPQSISNHVYYLSLNMKGEVVINGTSVKYNITSISANISALGLPPLPLNGIPIAPPQAIGSNIYFVYIPGVTSVSSLSSLVSNLTKAYLGYANYTNGSWHLKNVITSGIVRGISVYNNSLYALWKPSPTGETYLLLISQNQVVRNISVDVSNASNIEVGNDIGIVSNASLLSLNLQMSASANIKVEYFVINLTTGKVIYKIPDYNNISPAQVSVSNGLALVSYVPMSSPSSSITSYIVLYNLSTGKIISEKSFNGIALGYINGKFILIYNAQTSGTSTVDTFAVYNLSWGQLYREVEVTTPESYYIPDGLYVNSTAVTILLTHLLVSVNIQTNQVTMTSSLEFMAALQAPKPFTISVSQQHYPGYTVLNISWNETQPSTYLVYVNNTLIGQTKSEFIQYNVTENGTYLIKVVADNPLGEIQENTTVKVLVYPAQITFTTTITTTTSSSITTTIISTFTTTTSSTATTTSSSTTSSVTSSSTTTSTFTSSIFTTSPITSSQSKTSSSTPLIIAIVLIIVVVIALVLFLARRK